MQFIERRSWQNSSARPSEHCSTLPVHTTVSPGRLPPELPPPPLPAPPELLELPEPLPAPELEHCERQPLVQVPRLCWHVTQAVVMSVSQPEAHVPSPGVHAHRQPK